MKIDFEEQNDEMVFRISEFDQKYEPIVNTKGWVTKDFGVIFKHARIDIASDPQVILDDSGPIDCGPDAHDNLEEVIWKGFTIRVPPLQLSLIANRLP